VNIGARQILVASANTISPISTIVQTEVSMSKTVIIEAGRANRQYWRDLLVRYKQTVVGVAWVLLRPLLTLLIFSLVFGKLAGLPSGGVPYPLLVFSGMLPWFFFSSAISECSNSVLSNGSLVGKVYFPRLIIPLSSIAVNLVDYTVSCLLIVVLIAWTGVLPSWRIVILPLLTLWVAALALGMGIWGAALNVRYRDLRFVIPFVLQLGVYISPVGYSAAIVPERWRPLYSINPMVGIIDGFRWAILRTNSETYTGGVYISVFFTVVLLVTGVSYFRRVEKKFVDFL
jgi:lipopolysaccharide transport system permease protein